MNNPPISAVDVPEGSFWYNKTENTIRLFNVTRRWYNSNNILTFDLAELHVKGNRIREVFAKDFIENAQSGKIIYLNNLIELFNQSQFNEPTIDTNSASSAT